MFSPDVDKCTQLLSLLSSIIVDVDTLPDLGYVCKSRLSSFERVWLEPILKQLRMLERMIESLCKEMREKDEEIERLRRRIEELVREEKREKDQRKGQR